MSHHKQHFLVPNSQSIDDLAKLIWSITQKEQVSPIVVLSTSGPAYGLRQALDLHRPKDISPHLVFLPRVLGLTQWLKETPGLSLEGEAKSNLARWLEVYQALSARPQLRSILMDASESSKWGLAKNIIDACDIISEASLGVGDLDAEKGLLDAIDEVYQGASRVAIDTESKILLTFWQNLTTRQDPIARQRQALNWRAIEAQKKIQSPLIYVETAKSSPGFDEVLNHFFESYSSQSAVHHFAMDFNSVALWPECIDEASKDQVIDNQNRYFSELKSSQRKIIKSLSFEDAAWSGADAIQEFLKDGHHHIALIAQDRLVARRIRALLARFGSGVSIHDETGWKLSTTRAASALMSWAHQL
jgi:ATP-dependent helicase/nuclease subunit B